MTAKKRPTAKKSSTAGKRPAAKKSRTRAAGSISKRAPRGALSPRVGDAHSAHPGETMVMLVRFDGADPPLLKHVRGTVSPPGRKLRRMQLGLHNLHEVPPATGEVVAAFYDARRRPLSVFGWSSRPRYFGDRIVDVKVGSMGGGMTPPRYDDRLLHLHVPPGATYLLFARTRVVPVVAGEKLEAAERGMVVDGQFGTVRLDVQALGHYDLGAPHLPEFHPITFPLPIPGSQLEHPIHIEHLLGLPPVGWGDLPLRTSGWIESQETIQNHGNPATQFNIVITGDGFTHGEIEKLDERAKFVANALMSMSPFNALKERINIHLIRAASYSSGVYRCGEGSCEPAEAWPIRETYYEVEGCWPPCSGGASCPGFLGIPDAGRLYKAAEGYAPADQIHLFIVLVNASIYGGSASHEQRIAFLPLNEDWLAQLTAHESAHVIGDIVEEYTGKVAWDGISEHANEISRERRNQAWWKILATSEERSPGGGFRHIVDCHGPNDCEYRFNKRNLTDAEDPGWLGLFWGAQYLPKGINLNELNWSNEDRYTNCLGREFFRGQARCRMRSINWPFCRVCAEEMRRIIMDPSV